MTASNRSSHSEWLSEVAPCLPSLMADWMARPSSRYVDVRLDVVEGVEAMAAEGQPQELRQVCDVSFGVRVIAGEPLAAPGYFGRRLGLGDLPGIEEQISRGLQSAYARAMANAAGKARLRRTLPRLARNLWDTRLARVEVCRDTVPAQFRIDPRSIAPREALEMAREGSSAACGAHPSILAARTHVFTSYRRELFCSSEGTLIDQSSALTEGTLRVVAEGPSGVEDLIDHVGHQRGWEVLTEGGESFPGSFPAFCRSLARDCAELARAPALRPTAGEVTVVTDPHFNALLVHEIVGHPTELDRALKQETAYAGRSWLLRGLSENQVGRQIASELVSAYSDPSLQGYGHYVYDHEGTRGRRVMHIERGIFRGFMNSRQSAAMWGEPPNGSFTAVAACLVPLVRMAATVFATGHRDPAEILSEVDRGYWLVGHRIPSIAESRENFTITAKKVYEVRDGKPVGLYRCGGLSADSRDFLMSIDAVGSDFRLYPIPDCGKGQPMQTKRLSNGGPTLRGRGRLTGC